MLPDQATSGPDYYGHTRTDIFKLLPPSAERILDVGCGAGNTLRWLKTLYPDAQITGLEFNAAAADLARKIADRVVTCNLNEGVPDTPNADLVICLDVLEHLIDPASVLTKLSRRLTPGGQVIISLPNVAHFSVSLPLLLKGAFVRTESGIMDRTHLHWFTVQSAIELMEAAGLHVIAGLYSGIHGRKAFLMNMITAGRVPDRLARQIILRGGPTNPLGQAIKWTRVDYNAAI